MARSDLMAVEITSNSYEEARKQQLLENKKRFEVFYNSFLANLTSWEIW